MKSTVLAIAFAFASTGAYAECSYPKSPGTAPNGSTATKDEMIAGMQAVKKYDGEMNAYLACLDEEANKRIVEAGDDQERVKKIKDMTNKRHDDAVIELKKSADEFNIQLRAFNQKGKG